MAYALNAAFSCSFPFLEYMHRLTNDSMTSLIFPIRFLSFLIRGGPAACSLEKFKKEEGRPEFIMEFMLHGPFDWNEEII